MTSALIIGSGPNVAAELSLVSGRKFDYRIGVNQAAHDYGPVDFHVTLHPRLYAKTKAAPLVAPIRQPGVDHVMDWKWVEKHNSGSSGLYAVRWALKVLQCDEIVLAGVGIDVTPHYYGGGEWTEAMRFRATWEAVLSQLRGKVVSLGGWTRDLLKDR